MFKNFKKSLSHLREKRFWLPSLMIMLVAFLLILPQIISKGVIVGSVLLHLHRLSMKRLCRLRLVTSVILYPCMAFIAQGGLLMRYTVPILPIFKVYWF